MQDSLTTRISTKIIWKKSPKNRWKITFNHRKSCPGSIGQKSYRKLALGPLESVPSDNPPKNATGSTGNHVTGRRVVSGLLEFVNGGSSSTGSRVSQSQFHRESSSSAHGSRVSWVWWILTHRFSGNWVWVPPKITLPRRKSCPLALSVFSTLIHRGWPENRTSRRSGPLSVRLSLSPSESLLCFTLSPDLPL